MAKSVEEKLVIGVGVLGLLILFFRVIRLFWTGVALARNNSANREENELADR